MGGVRVVLHRRWRDRCIVCGPVIASSSLCRDGDLFEHVLELPQAFHSEAHSGRVLKVMLGHELDVLVVARIFRSHLAALVALVILLPLTLFMNWQLGLLLLVLVTVFAVCTTLVLNKTLTMQDEVEQYRSILRAMCPTPSVIFPLSSLSPA